MFILKLYDIVNLIILLPFMTITINISFKFIALKDSHSSFV